MLAVLVFTGSVSVTLLASLTMASINAFVLGMYWLLGWQLGAIEGVGLTTLVGLSVDFCIHFSEAFVRSPLTQRRHKARYAAAAHAHAAVGTVQEGLELHLVYGNLDNCLQACKIVATECAVQGCNGNNGRPCPCLSYHHHRCCATAVVYADHCAEPIWYHHCVLAVSKLGLRHVHADPAASHMWTCSRA
jgi:Patched family